MKENKYTELDKLFRNRINRSQDQSSDWNTPPDSVFSAAMKTLDDKKKRKRKVIFLWLFPFLIIATLSSLLIWNQGKLNKMNEKMDRLLNQQEIVNSSPVLSLNQKSQEEERNEKSIEKFDSKITEQDGSNLPVASKTEVFLRSNTKTVDNLLAEGLKSEIIESEILVDLHTVLTEDKEIRENTKGDELQLGYIPSIPITFFEDLNTQNLDNFKLTSYKVSNEKNVKAPLILYGTLGSNLSSFSMQSDQGLSSKLTGYDRFYPGFNASIGVKKLINDRWSLNANLQYNYVRNQSAFKSWVYFDESDENIDINGKRMYEPMIEFDSPLGIVNRSFGIELGTRQIGNNEKLKTNTEISNTFQVLGIGSNLEFKIYDGNKFEVAAFAGVSGNAILSFNQEMDLEIYQQGDMMFKDTFIKSPEDQLNRFFITSNGGIEIKYQFNDHLYMGLGVQFQRSLSTLRNSSPDQNLTTHLSQWNNGLTLGYQF